MTQKTPIGSLRWTRLQFQKLAVSLCVLTGEIFIGPFPAYSQVASEPMIKGTDRLTAILKCDNSKGASEIVVCGRSNPNDRYRLPLYDGSNEDSASRFSGAARGEIPRATVQLASGPCGNFNGGRQCSKAESRAFYGTEGASSDPITFLINVATIISDKDASVTPPPPIPKLRERRRP